ncbi:6-carboxytetrahydropterin synthase QueD [Patescibacteria group bacterium]
MLLTKVFTFDSAHFLPNYHGKCENMHGHTYKLEVTIEGEPNKEDGMIYDFAQLKELVNKKVVDKLDHTNLNDTIKNPSAEFIAMWIWDQLKNDLNLKQIKVFESSNSYVTYEGN